MAETVESIMFGFTVAPAPLVGEARSAEEVRSHPARIGRVGSRREWMERAQSTVMLYGYLYGTPSLMTRRAMGVERRLRSQLRRSARRLERKARR